MKKVIIAGAVLIVGCLAPVDPNQPPLGAGSRLLGFDGTVSLTTRQARDFTYVDLRPALGFLFVDNVAIVLTPFVTLEDGEDWMSWQRYGLCIAGDWTLYRPGRNVHVFVLGEVGLSVVRADDSVAGEDDCQGISVGLGAGVRMFHSSYCSLDMGVYYRHLALDFNDLNQNMTFQQDVWVGASVKLYFPVQKSLKMR